MDEKNNQRKSGKEGLIMKKSKKILILVISVIVALALIVGGIFVVKDKLSKKAIIPTEDVEVENITEILEERIKDSSELVTAQYICTYSKQYTSEKEAKKFKVPFTKKHFIVQYDGVVKAGIKELNKIKFSAPDENNVIKAKLPNIEIISSNIDHDSLKVLDESKNVFNPITISDTNNAQKDLEKEMKNNALERGLLEQARENAELILKTMLSCDGYTIEFE